MPDWERNIVLYALMDSQMILLLLMKTTLPVSLVVSELMDTTANAWYGLFIICYFLLMIYFRIAALANFHMILLPKIVQAAPQDILLLMQVSTTATNSFHTLSF